MCVCVRVCACGFVNATPPALVRLLVLSGAMAKKHLAKRRNHVLQRSHVVHAE